MVVLAIRRVNLVIPLFHFQPIHIDCLQDFDPEAPRLLGHALGEFLSADAFGKTRKVIESNRDACLSTQTGTLDQKYICAFARGIDRGSQSREPGRIPPGRRC